MPEQTVVSVFAPPDQAERSRALDPTRSFLVQAPAGSGKTYLLTQRFLKLLSQVERPDEVVAITFTNAAAAEMRNRILEALERAEREPYAGDDVESLAALAAAALKHAKRQGWQILDQPSQLRITTIDSFCRGLALQSPLSWGLLSGLGGRLDPVEKPVELYRTAARRTLQVLKAEDSATRRAVEEVLLWRDNNWKDVEDLIVDMLAQRNRWYQEFVFARDENWELLRERLEAPFQRAARHRVETLWRILDGLPDPIELALSIARFACETPGKSSPVSLAERAELPIAFAEDGSNDEALFLADAVEAYRSLACFLLTDKGEWRRKGGLTVHRGFPRTAAGKAAKKRYGELVASLAAVPGLRAALGVFQKQMPLGYTEDEWRLMRHCFVVLRNAAVELQMVFAESGEVDFTEISQIALRILGPENGFPSDFAIRQADGIRHLLIDEFQDTSRNQHQLLARLIAAWPEWEGRSCFCVGDPMQSIYGFREAEVELFERLKTHGLDTASDPSDSLAEPFRFEFVSLRANFRTVPSLVDDLNSTFKQIFAQEDGSGVRFSEAEAARNSTSLAKAELHLAFTGKGSVDSPEFADCAPNSTRKAQLDEIVALIRSRLCARSELRGEARQATGAAPETYRIAVLGRTRSSLVRIAEALQQAGIGFRALDLVMLRERPEVLDVLSLARALLNPVDRSAWLGVLRAPWCGLTLEELHLLTSADDPVINATPIPELLQSRLPVIYDEGRVSQRTYNSLLHVASVLSAAAQARSAANSALGTWLESIWKALGGADTVGPEQRENLRLLWAALDKMPQGDLDLLGPGLHAALDDLYALPDPTASSDFGVQLMTIHKSKGLEFEVVLVPDLEAEGRTSERTMISWLERGLKDPHGGGEQVTEFLIAPIQAKGSDAGSAKQWVDQVKKERERQELRRVLYVAATRAREELHLFTRPRFSASRASGEISLAKASGLLLTAWPALQERVEGAFAEWLGERAAAKAHASAAVVTLELESLAAQAGQLAQMPSGVRPAARSTLVRRLPEGYRAPGYSQGSMSSSRDVPDLVGSPGEVEDPTGQRKLFSRIEGGLRSRVLGAAIHSFLERLSDLRKHLIPAEAAEAIEESIAGVTAIIRGHGLPRAAAERLAIEALAVARQASVHSTGAWILTPHANAEVEARWTGVSGAGGAEKQPWNLRPDRIFFAGDPPCLSRDFGADCGIYWDSSHIPTPRSGPSWWIIDYKSSHAEGVLADDGSREQFLRTHRERHAGQLSAYAEVLRNFHGEKDGQQTDSSLKVTAGIFYPRLQILHLWDA